MKDFYEASDYSRAMNTTPAAESPCAPCVKAREGCRRCRVTAAENSVLIKKLESYEKKHVAKQERNTSFITTLFTLAFCFWISTIAFANNMACMIVAWAALGLACVFMIAIVDNEYTDRGVPSMFA